MPRSTNVNELRAFLGMTVYLRQHVEDYGIVAAPLTNLLRNKAFASKRTRKIPIECVNEKEAPFVHLKGILPLPLVLAFPS